MIKEDRKRQSRLWDGIIKFILYMIGIKKTVYLNVC